MPDIPFDGNKNVKDFVDNLNNELKKSGTETVKSLAAQTFAANKKITEQLYNEELALKQKLGEFLAKNEKKNKEFLSAYAQSEQHKLNKQKLDDELATFKQIKVLNEDQRKKDLENTQNLIKLQKELIKAEEGTDEKKKKDAKKALADEEKRQARDKQKKERRETADNGSFKDIFVKNLEQLQEERDKGFKNTLRDTTAENMMRTIQGVGKAIENSLNVINNAIDKYASYQTTINSRLQGSTAKSFGDVADSLNDIAFSPLLKAEDLYGNLNTIVNQGIASNVEQKAMLQTVKDGIASTFDVTDASLKRIIRVQQNDSTAARLGMEAYLTKFLNTYVENTEYLTSTFDNVASSLFEASAVLGSTKGSGASAEFEYVVQKWLGTLTGVGLSDNAAQAIAGALGQLGSGDVDGLAGSNMQNLLVMAASKSNLNYAKLLNEGLNAGDANELMKGVVSYLKDVATTGTNVVKNQLAKIFGVSVSDLVSINNLSSSDVNVVYNDMLSYGQMYGELSSQMDQLKERIGISNLLNNAFSNFTFQTGMDIASNPASFALWKITDLIQGVTGGINIPTVGAFGNFIGLNTTVENLMKLGLVGASTLGNIGTIVNSIGTASRGSSLLDVLQISAENSEVKSFGGQLLDATGKRLSGSTTSENVYIGQMDQSTYQDSALNSARDSAQQEVDAKSQEVEDPTVKYLQELAFQEGFESIVQNVAQILEKMPTFPTDIDGWSQSL